MERKCHLEQNLVIYKDWMLLSVCLMAGAAADFLCTLKFDWARRLIPILVGIIFLLLLGIIYYPGGPEPENKDILFLITIFYFVTSFIFCVILKFILFLEESISDLPTKS